MKYSIEIGKIVEGALKSDINKVRNYCIQLIKKLDDDGDVRTANKFKKLVEISMISTMSPISNSKVNLPVDLESRTQLADIIFPCDNDIEVVLTEENKLQVEEFIKNYLNADRLSEFGISNSNSMILYGPPGCGKTNCAMMIAKKLDLPIVIARLDSLISSYLGTTSKNIRSLFEYVEKMPCVLFLDEFDALAKARDDNNELGELKRVVNSLLQNIDNMSKDSVIIAATNHEKLLDSAIWRRFDYRINILQPDIHVIQNIINLFVRDRVRLNEKQVKELALCFDGCSGAKIKEILNKAFRNAIVHNQEISIKIIYEQIFVNKKLFDKSAKARYLRSLNVDEKVFTYEHIGEILGMSKSSVLNLLKEGE